MYPVVPLTEYGIFQKCTAKSVFLNCLDELLSLYFEQPIIQVKVVNDTAFVNMHQSILSRIFGKYCREEFRKKIVSLTYNIVRIDFVFDTYLPSNIKTQTRESRGARMRVSVRKEKLLCNKFQGFLGNSKSKIELFIMIADAHSPIWCQKAIVATAQM